MITKFYPKTSPSLSLSDIDQKVLSYWEKENIFSESIKSRENSDSDQQKEFIFYDGPPFANGLPHYGHLLTGFIKDSVARFQTNLGKKVQRKFGWDCHGLPAEMAAEKELKISGRNNILKYGIKNFNDHCRESVMKYANKWKEYVTKQARWVDFDDSYKTMDINYMESVIWGFKKLYDKGYIYESMRVMPYSWACETPLSNFETRLDNSYRERTDKAITVSFIMQDINNILPGNYKEYRILAWTTTPWTLPSNLALAVNKDITYAIIEHNNIGYILADSACTKYAKELSITDKTQKHYISGNKLKDINYKPLFPYFENHENSFKIILADFVEENDGTGIVHLAPGFGEDDQIICESHGINIVCPVDSTGKFTDEVKDFYGINVFDTNDGIIIKLKNQNNWIKTEQYTHNYPHCWRTDTPLIYKALPSWYVKVTEFKDQMVKLNQEINWVPSHIKNGLFGKWLENARDWSISRNRFWGTPIPVWRSDNPEYPRIDVYGSIKEIERDFNVTITDLHKHQLDKLERKNPDDPSGKSMMKRTEDVFDCWFESGSMPHAQAHYPFENQEWFEKNFPADFIVEYVAQTRGWFYTLIVLSTALFGRPPFLNCICHGVILDEKGQKLSKRLNNYIDPLKIFEKFGSDSLRYAMLSSSVSKGADLLIDKEGGIIYDSLRLAIKPIWNSYHFFILYADSDNITCQINYSSESSLDQYILSKLALTIKDIKESMESYNIQNAYLVLNKFFDLLNNWYIRRSRDIFWKSQKDQEKQNAYNTLFTCLDHISKAACSILPIIFEEIYQGIHKLNYLEKKSVHLEYFPLIDQIKIDENLIKLMDQVIDVCSSALFIRNKEYIRIRQPLESLKIISYDSDNLKTFDYLIKSEVNVKNVEYIQDIKSYVTEEVKINYKILGKRIPTKIKDIIKNVKNKNWKFINGELIIADEIIKQDEYQIIMFCNDDSKSSSLKSSKGIIILDTEINNLLYQEGITRDIIRYVQQARKEANLVITDRINLEIIASKKIMESINNFITLIQSQTLSILTKVSDPLLKSDFVINNENVRIQISLVKL